MADSAALSLADDLQMIAHTLPVDGEWSKRRLLEAAALIRSLVTELEDCRKDWKAIRVAQVEKENDALQERLAATEAVAKRLQGGFAPVIVSPEAGNWYWHRSIETDADRWEPMSEAEREVLDRLNEGSDDG